MMMMAPLMTALEENGVGENEDFDGFDKNEDVTIEADKAYMDALDNLT